MKKKEAPATNNTQVMWACSRCTFDNLSEALFCEMCLMDKPTAPIPPQSAAVNYFPYTTTTSQDTFEGFVVEEPAVAAAEEEEVNTIPTLLVKEEEKEECKRFKRTGECKFGDECTYLHVRDVKPTSETTTTATTSSTEVCKSWKNAGKCTFSNNCRYLHLERDQEICRLFVMGICKRGKDCHYSHLVDPDLLNSVPIRGSAQGEACRLFQRGACKLGKQCKYSHAPKPEVNEFEELEICKFWALTKTCKFGDECFQLHIDLPKEEVAKLFSAPNQKAPLTRKPDSFDDLPQSQKDRKPRFVRNQNM